LTRKIAEQSDDTAYYYYFTVQQSKFKKLLQSAVTEYDISQLCIRTIQQPINYHNL